jgi:importin subunit beta-1
MDILQTLENALLGTDPNKRTEAELQLSEAANSHFDKYLLLLIEALTNEEAKVEVRILAGLGLKNQLTAKDQKTKTQQQEHWLSLDDETRSKIKLSALLALLTSEPRVGGSAAQLVASIADIELPRNTWPELIPTIIENTKPEKPEHVKRTSQLAIGYICETADPNNPAILAQSNGILIAIVQGVQANEPSNKVRLTALNALVNSLEFISNNFEREGERNYIMQVVCEATQADDAELQASAFGCLARIMSIYYRFMRLYMEKALYGLTVSGMQSEDEKVSCMAVEFWSTVCEEELEIAMDSDILDGTDSISQDQNLQSFNFALVAIQDVLPTLLTLLTRQNDDPEDDDWSVAMAAGACLQLFAQNTGNYVVEPTLQFVSANINSDNWRYKEAAVMAFGSILEGPDRDSLGTLIVQALDPILMLIKDENLQVKETVAWCLGRIAELSFNSIDIEQQLPGLLGALVSGLQDHPKVSTNCCWTLINIVEEICVISDQNQTSPMSNYYPTIIPILVELSGKADNDFSGRVSAYEALSSFVTYSANDTLPLVENIATEVLSRLEKTVTMQSQVHTVEEKGNLEELQINILSLLTNIIRRLKNAVAGAADNLMEIFIKLLDAQEPNSIIEEDILLAISSIASAVNENFDKYMPVFLPYLTKTLQNTESPSSNVAVGIVADLAQSMGLQILPYLEGIMTLLGQNLSDISVRRELRPAILSCFGDIAATIGVNFQTYLDFVMNICIQASNIEINDTTLETYEYVLNIKEGVVDCYVGIVSGMSTEPQIIYPYCAPIFQFIQLIAQDGNTCTIESIARATTGLLGDLAAMYPNGEFKQAFEQPWVTEFIKKTRSYPIFGQKTKEAARWARDQQKRQIAL